VTEWSGAIELDEQEDAPASIARHRCAISEHEPPAFAASSWFDGRQQSVRFVVLERQQRELVVDIEPGDDPRRPAAQPTAAVVEHHEAADVSLHVAVVGTCH
jgi:hypothetical protein